MERSVVNWRSVIRIAGAYVAWVMGSGFATGQEILQFFTSYGYYSFVLLGINLAGFLLIGPMILEAGREHADDPGYDHFVYFCGRRLGTVYSWFLPMSMFAGMVILISGSGATLQEYYGMNHYVGAIVMAGMALTAYIIGFHRFVRVVSFIGPVIIAFTVVVGIVTVCRDFGGLMQVGPLMNGTGADPAAFNGAGGGAAAFDGTARDAAAAIEKKQPAPWWWLSGLLYISYNLCGGSKYYSALGATAGTVREARLGAVLGTVALMASILLMNTAMLTDLANVAVLDVPTLYLAHKIAYILGAVFSIILIMGIFSSCSAMLWTISEKFVVQGSCRSYFFAAGVCALAFLLGLLSFSGLVGVVYTILGYIGLFFIGCVVRRRITGNGSNRDTFHRD